MTALPRDYFSLFGIAPQLALDLPELQRQFYVLSRQYHPDRFARAAAGQQEYALQFTSMLNDAWRTLKDPNTRAEYLLQLSGLETGDSRANPVPPELLEEVFELNMALEEARDGDKDAEKQVRQALEHFQQILQSLDMERDLLFSAYDSTQDPLQLQALRTLMNRRKYIANLVRDAQQALS